MTKIRAITASATTIDLVAGGIITTIETDTEIRSGRVSS